MPSYVLQDKTSRKFLQKTDAWGHTLTDDLQKARVYTTAAAAKRTATNRPAYAKDELPVLEMVEVKLTLA